MTRDKAIAALEVAVSDWKRHGGPPLRVSFMVEDRPTAAHLVELGIEPEWKGAAVVSDPPGTRWGRFVEWLRGGRRSVVFVFAGNCLDAHDVRRVVWHELAHVAGLDEVEAEELGFPSWSKQD